MGETLEALLAEVRGCNLCAAELPLGPRPVVQADARARILLASQAPGRAVHESGIPFDDPSGRRLREWLGVSPEQFYDASRFAIVPMGFCYPGKGKSGDLPPRRECAPQWRAPLLAALPQVELLIAVGGYAVREHLAERSLTAAVENFRTHLPAQIALPHPSPRNTYWLQKHPWFERDVLPALRRRVRQVLSEEPPQA